MLNNRTEPSNFFFSDFLLYELLLDFQHFLNKWGSEPVRWRVNVSCARMQQHFVILRIIFQVSDYTWTKAVPI